MFSGIAINEDFRGKHILSISQFSQKSILKLFKKTHWIINRIKQKRNINILKRSVAALLFFEPSTRTFLSFSSAIKKMGGETVDFLSPDETTSFVKGESISDAVKVFSAYTDLIIIRHPEKGFVQKVAEVSQVPVISGGDGAGEHPTQALYDAFTIHQKFGKLSGLKGLILGDVLYSRSIHSLLKTLALFKGNSIYLYAPKRLELSKELAQELKGKIKIQEINKVDDIPQDCHFWYTNRIQKERFKNMKLYQHALRSFPVITKSLLEKKGNKNMVILDPLPRVKNTDPEIDSDPRALYLTRQLENGMFVRMALVGLVLGKI